MITVETKVNAPVEKVWDYFTNPKHIVNWYFASNDWHAPAAENDLKVGGKFKTVMAARDGSMGFDYEGTYTAVTPHKQIDYHLADGRKVHVSFSKTSDEITTVTEQFDPEQTNPLEMQKGGWQAILNNFKTYTETH